MRLGNRVGFYRAARGETVRSLAETVGMTAGHLWRVEQGTHGCSDEKKLALARHFGVTVADLFFQPRVDNEATADEVVAK